MGARRWIARCLGIATLATGAGSFWALSQNPFAEAYVARSVEATRAVIFRQMARAATPERLIAEVEQALSDDDMDTLLIALNTATAQGHTLPRPLLERALEQAEAAQSPARRMSDCAACAWDIAQCQTVAQITACALPVEITPLGDVNALRRGAAAYAAGQDIDQLDVGLAFVGLAATGAILITAGGSTTIKAGATALRLARRSGRLTPGLSGVLARNSNLLRDAGAIPAYLAGRVPLDRVADTAKLARLRAVATDLGTLARNTSPGEAVVMLRHVDTAEDAARLARLSTATGPNTRATVHILGKARALRATVRISDLVLATLGLLGALAMQVLAWLIWGLRLAVKT